MSVAATGATEIMIFSLDEHSLHVALEKLNKDANVILAQTSHLVNSQSSARLLRQAGGLYAYFFQKM